MQGSFLGEGFEPVHVEHVSSQNTRLPSGQMWYITIQRIREGNLMIPPVSWHHSQMVFIMSAT